MGFIINFYFRIFLSSIPYWALIVYFSYYLFQLRLRYYFGSFPYHSKPYFCRMAPAGSSSMSALYTLAQARGISLNYRLVQADGPPHSPTYSYQVTCGHLVSGSMGCSKRSAMRLAAQRMLDMLTGRTPVTHSQVPLPPVVDTIYSLTDSLANPCGALHHLCMVKKLPEPLYVLIGKDQGGWNFVFTCSVPGFHEEGVGCNKKEARQDVAQAVLILLRFHYEDA